MAETKTASQSAMSFAEVAKFLGLSVDDLKEVGFEQATSLIGRALYPLVPKSILKQGKASKVILGTLISLIFRAILPEKKDWAKQAEKFTTDVIGAMTTLAENGGDSVEATVTANVPKEIGSFGLAFSILAKTQDGLEVLQRMAEYGEQGSAMLRHFAAIKPEQIVAQLQGLKPDAVDALAKILGLKSEEERAEEKAASAEFWNNAAVLFWAMAGTSAPALTESPMVKLEAVWRAAFPPKQPSPKKKRRLL